MVSTDKTVPTVKSVHKDHQVLTAHKDLRVQQVHKAQQV